MARALDHIVVAGHDLAALRDFYHRLGFQVGRRNLHPWGTENHIIQFDGVFLELIGLPSEGQGLTEPAPYFAAFVRDYLAKRQGLAMLVLASQNAMADHGAFRAQDIGYGEVFHFSRQAVRPDGQPINVAFSLAFARPHACVNCGFFTCQQHFPENFWNPAFQTHENGVLSLTEVIFAADETHQHSVFMAEFTGNKPLSPEAGHSIYGQEGQRVIVAHSDILLQDYGIAVESGPLHMVALGFAVRDLAAFKVHLQAQNIDYSICQGRVIVGPAQAFGAFLMFAQI